MTEKLQQSIKEIIAKLPEEAQSAIMAVDWASLSEEIGKKHFLADEEISKIQAETFIIISGIDIPDNYVWNIERELELDTKEIEKITEEVNQKIFNPIYAKISKNLRESLKRKEPSWKQNLDFILSSGDYSVFLKPIESNIKVNMTKIDTSFIMKKNDNLENKFGI